jgi:hypothetical protein
LVLQRRARRPLTVVGRSLLSAHNRCAGLFCWSELAIYETASGCFAAVLRHVPAAAAQQIWADAWLCASAEEVRRVFHEHDPLCALPPLASPHPQERPDSPCIVAAVPSLGDTLSARRYQAAWAGLLAAVFGIFPPRTHAPD